MCDEQRLRRPHTNPNSFSEVYLQELCGSKMFGYLNRSMIYPIWIAKSTDWPDRHRAPSSHSDQEPQTGREHNVGTHILVFYVSSQDVEYSSHVRDGHILVQTIVVFTVPTTILYLIVAPKSIDGWDHITLL